SSVVPCALLSFPTRRSSDLPQISVAALVAILLVLAVFDSSTNHAQMRREGHPLASDLFAATTRNVLLRNELEWKFGGKPNFHSRDRKSTRLNSSHDQISYAV